MNTTPECPTVTTRWRVFSLGLGLMLSASSHANGAAIAQGGVGAAPACQTCHGTAGEGIAQAGFPRLAGLGAPYMQRQLTAFADGSRVSDVMMPIAKALSAAQRVEVSEHYAALPVSAAPAAATPAPASVGSVLATRGRWADQLPASGLPAPGRAKCDLPGQPVESLENRRTTAWPDGADGRRCKEAVRGRGARHR